MAERGLASRLVEFCVLCVCIWLQKCMPVVLMFRDISCKAHEYGLIEYPRLVVRLGVIRCCGEMFSSKEGAHCSKGFDDELCTFVSEYIRPDSVGEEPMIKEDIRNRRGCCYRRGYSSSQLKVLTETDKYELATW